jgi:hypothetical protein
VSVEDLFVRVIDRDAMVRGLTAWIAHDGVPATFEAAALVHLDCGHVRPMNLWFEPGDELPCHVCGPAIVVGLELIETTEFPHPDALTRSPELA